MKLVSVSEMVAVEKAAVEAGLSYGEMMENAAKGLAEYIGAAHSLEEEKTVGGLVGKGNNGGDTLIALAMLAGQGWRATAYIIEGRNAEDGLLERLMKAGGEVILQSGDKSFAKLRAMVRANQVVLDGLLGTGIKLPLKEPAAGVLKAAKQTLAKLENPPVVVGVDCPSGVDCDTGEVADECLAADTTVCMAAVKQGLLCMPAFEYLGELVLVDIGLPPKLKEWKAIRRRVVDEYMVRDVLPARPLDGHKGTFGTALVVAGSVNYTGAALLAGEGAYRIGAGLVSMAVPRSLWVVLAGTLPEAVWVPLNEEQGAFSPAALKEFRKHIPHADAMLIGPGFGLAEGTRGFLSGLLSGTHEQEKQVKGLITSQAAKPRADTVEFPPMVVDADGLKLLASMEGWHLLLPPGSVLTPHPGEMAVLTGLATSEIQENRREVAERFAKEWGHVVVLKGAFTVIAAPEGESSVVPVATPALGRAGSGDVLAGMITGLLAQGVSSYDAACAGAWLHAQAGLAAAESLGTTVSVLARDLVANLPIILKRFGK